MQHGPDDIAKRFEAVFGYGWRSDFAETLDIRGATISEQFSRQRVQPWLVALLEFLKRPPQRTGPTVGPS